MRDRKIIIKPFEYVALLDMQIHKCINEHATASVVMRIKEENVEKYMNFLLENKQVTIEAESEQREHKILFFGIVVDFSIMPKPSDPILKLEIVSSSFYMDINQHFRSFQNSHMTHAQLHQSIIEKYPDGSVSMQKQQENMIKQLIIQYEETDWEFAKRVASMNNGFILPFISIERIGYHLGFPAGTVRTLESNAQVCVHLSNGGYLIKEKNGLEGISEYDEIELEVESREIYDIGDIIQYNLRTYFIYDICCRYEKSECQNTYLLKTEAGLKIMKKQNVAIRGCSFEGEVTDVKEDKVKIDLVGDENNEMIRKWFRYATIYSSPDGTGWYYMPEIGDSIRLYIPESEEGAYVASAVHKETDSARQNPDYKSLKTKYGKEILFTPNTLIMTNNKGMMIELSDEDGISIVSNKDITIKAEGNMTIGSQDESVLIAAQDKLQIEQCENKMTLSEDISFTGGEFRMQ